MTAIKTSALPMNVNSIRKQLLSTERDWNVDHHSEQLHNLYKIFNSIQTDHLAVERCTLSRMALR